MSHEYTAGMAHTAAERGAKWLDKRYPDWPKTIDVYTLDLGRPHCCILGQTAAAIVPDADALVKLNPYAAALDHFTPVAGRKWAARYGFDLPVVKPDEFSAAAHREYPIYYEMLTIAWKELIRQRLEAKSA